MELAASARVLPFQHRRDIVVEPVILRGRNRMVLKDPLTLRYWEFGDEECFLWRQLDQQLTLEEWQRRFHKQFSPQRIDLTRLREFLEMLHREGLIFSTVSGQADTMLVRRSEQARGRANRAWSNLLAIRFRGVDPERFLTRVYPAIAWLFHPLAVISSLLFMLSAVLIVVLRWSEITSGLPDIGSFMTAQNVIWLAMALSLAKILHELGHAFTNKHFGGECHELGIMLFLFTPCLYCNVSDTWLVSDKWRRIAVSAAGMYVECLLAATATWLWWFSSPGPFNSLCLSILAVCSVGTVVFNGNPLLRYDGYFIFSDLVEVPNLRSEADARLRAFVLWHLFGIDNPSQQATPRVDAGLVIYGALSLVYRLAVIGLVLWFIHEWLRARGLAPIGIVMVSLIAMSLVAPEIRRARDFFASPRRGLRLNGRMLFTAIASAGLIFVLLVVPMPRRVQAPVVVQPAACESVYVSVPGTLVESVATGTRVRKGDQIAKLTNHELDFELIRLTSERDRLRKYRELLRRQQVHDTRTGIKGVGARLPVAEQSLRDTERLLQQRIADWEKLVLRAPRDGIVLAPRGKTPTDGDDELMDWSGTPLDVQNIGCFLEAGVLLCQIGKPGHIEAIAVLEQADFEDVRLGQPVQLQLDELPQKFLRGSVVLVSETNAEDVPVELVNKGVLPGRGQQDAKRFPGAYYQIKIAIPGEVQIPFGASGQAKLTVDPRTLVDRAYESLCRTFGLAG